MRLRQVVLGISASLLATVTLVALGPSSPVSANPAPGIKPDIILTPGEEPKFLEYNSTLVGMNRTENPESCRTHPVFNHSCDALRLKLNLSKRPGAENFVVMELNWDHIEPPSVVLGVAGLSPGVVPDLDIVVFRNPTTSMSPTTVGGQVTVAPEKLAFVANQSEYDIVVKADQGMVQKYSIRAYMTDEVFGSQFELLDEVLDRVEDAPPAQEFQEDFVAPPIETGGSDFANAISNSLAPLPAANVLPDRQFGGQGFRIQESFPSAIDLSKGRTTRVVAVGKAPSGAILVMALLIVPLAAAAGGTLWLRRRRQALI